ncbi:uncharacterized protein K02A2.6-like [Rhagoletis pomonella]|uniref:uncharacterized protein K02A2.6-like n=1 Tax=Rhagoletis pomonella TaxID=28610 RepID=UPI001781C22D|nr:uncharacterized protein K02A2.6-like [Rhagoletis pomonella]
MSQKETANTLDVNEASFESIGLLETINSVDSEDKPTKVFVKLNVNKQSLKFQVDTGASCSLIGLSTYVQLGRPPYSPTQKVLKAYGGSIIQLRGVIQVDVTHGGTTKRLPVLLVESDKATNIMGLDWFQALNFSLVIPTEECYANNSYITGRASETSLIVELQQLAREYQRIFSADLGLCTTFKAEIKLKPDARPKFYKPYNLPFAQYDEVRDEIERLVKAKVLTAIKASEWAAPIVVVKKPKGGVRICADFKVTVNPQIEIDRYPIPRIEELFHKLQNGKFFTKIDLSEAYLQVEVSEEAKKFLVINTPFGLYQYQRMPFGIASAPGLFQRLMENVIAGIPHSAVYLDDIIVSGRTNEEHLDNVRTVFQRLLNHGLKCKLAKCSFAKDRVEYVGHIIDANGILPSENKIEAIKLMPRPQNIQELEAFIGKINYYNKFVGNFASIAATLNILRRKHNHFKWSSSQETAFQSLKLAIIKATQLVHYDDRQPIILAVDASKHGIGAVISHRYSDGSEKPIAHTSKTLNTSQL